MRDPAIRSECLKMKNVRVFGPKLAEFYSSGYFITYSFGFTPYQLCMSLNCCDKHCSCNLYGDFSWIGENGDVYIDLIKEGG